VRGAVDDVKAALAERIDTLEWMSDATKVDARRYRERTASIEKQTGDGMLSDEGSQTEIW
jgi:predicted metalloendopeptidase